jgi:DNA polymerase-3 subunit beta
MRLAVERDALLDALGLATRIASRGDTAPILKHCLLDIRGGVLRLHATNLDLVAVAKTPVDASSDGRTTLPAAALKDLVRRYGRGSAVQIEIGDGQLVKVSSGRSMATLPSLPVDDFPDITGAAHSGEIVLTGRDLASLLRITAGAADPEAMERYFYRGVGLHFSGADMSIRSVAADGSRMFRVRVPAPLGAHSWPSITLPSPAAREIAHLANANADEPFRLSASGSALVAECAKASITTKLMDVAWPNYEQIIPREFVSTVRVEADILKRAIQRALVAATDRTRSITFALAGGLLSIHSEARDGSSVSEEIEVDVEDGASFSARVDARYIESVGEAMGSDVVRILYAGQGLPFVMLPFEGDDILGLIQPLRS